jgi:diphthamide biosynthesis protein 4
MSNYYQILGLPRTATTSSIKVDVLKDAYRKTLLKYHPDKVAHCEDVEVARIRDLGVKETITVDEITKAYKTLCNSISRAEYDRQLAQYEDGGTEATKRAFNQTGLDVVDLDSLTYDERKKTWSRACRCGDSRGFVVHEAELENHVQDGELTVGCRGCSLWLKVLFGTDEGD